jgi:spore coat polysaccharide biosynthesis protein SpsF (cytidylyltransferase family)
MILAILQARTSSTRLAGKVLKEIAGKPMLEHQIERINRSQLIDKLIVATSIDRSDNVLEELCHKIGIDCYRGSLDNVLDRFYQAAKIYKPAHIVRLTGDCPLTDPQIIDQTIQFYLDGRFDYASNCQDPSFPDGLDVEIFKAGALEEAWKNATLPSETEHVTPYIKNHPDIFRIGSFRGKEDLSHLRWCVDEPEDFEFATRIYEELYSKNPEFLTDDILHLLEQKPELTKINTGIERNAGYKKSLEQDEIS